MRYGPWYRRGEEWARPFGPDEGPCVRPECGETCDPAGFCDDGMQVYRDPARAWRWLWYIWDRSGSLLAEGEAGSPEAAMKAADKALNMPPRTS